MRGQRVTCKCWIWNALLLSAVTWCLHVIWISVAPHWKGSRMLSDFFVLTQCSVRLSKKKPGNNYSMSPGLGIRQGKASHPDTLFFFLKRMLNWPEGNRGKLFSFPFVQHRLQGNGHQVKTIKLDCLFEFHQNIKRQTRGNTYVKKTKFVAFKTQI